MTIDYNNPKLIDVFDPSSGVTLGYWWQTKRVNFALWCAAQKVGIEQLPATARRLRQNLSAAAGGQYQQRKVQLRSFRSQAGRYCQRQLSSGQARLGQLTNSTQANWQKLATAASAQWQKTSVKFSTLKWPKLTASKLKLPQLPALKFTPPQIQPPKPFFKRTAQVRSAKTPPVFSNIPIIAGLQQFRQRRPIASVVIAICTVVISTPIVILTNANKISNAMYETEMARRDFWAATQQKAQSWGINLGLPNFELVPTADALAPVRVPAPASRLQALSPLEQCRVLASTRPTVGAMRADPALAEQVLSCRDIVTADNQARQAEHRRGTLQDCRAERSRLARVVGDIPEGAVIDAAFAASYRPVGYVANVNRCRAVDYTELEPYVTLLAAQQAALTVASDTPPAGDPAAVPVTPTAEPLVISSLDPNKPASEIGVLTVMQADKPAGLTY